MTEVRFTHVGGPTVLVEFAGWRILTDPTFDAPGRRYPLGWGLSTRKLAGPAVGADDLPPVDAVLLSHDHHDDNLDDAGRALLPSVPVTVTTRAGAGRLRAKDGLAADAVRGLAAGESTRLEAPGRPAVVITATPCRHGPPLSGPIVGEVAGFALEWEGQEHGPLWMTGDTVLYPAVRETAARLRPGTVLLHLGGVRFTATGPLRYTMVAADAVELCEEVRPRTVLPVHFEGWEHFKENRAAVEARLGTGPSALRDAVAWMTPGEPLTVTV